jgi:hypothetical protein
VRCPRDIHGAAAEVRSRAFGIRSASGRGGATADCLLPRVRAILVAHSEPGPVQTTRPLAASSPALKAAIAVDLAISPPGLPEGGAPGSHLVPAAASQAGQRRAVTAPHRARTVVRVGGRFRLDDRAGELSGASLWKGTDELLRRPVAVYRLPPSLPVAAGVVAAVRAAARVSDPRLARVFDADFSTGSPYIVTEWAPGEHVDDLLIAGPPSPALAAAIIADAADALAVAHDAGLPHLRLVPRSLHWDASGVKITGLGIEAALAGAGARDPAAADTRALARILYALLTGYWPGEEATRLPPAPRHRGRLCPPRQAQPGIPGTLSATTIRALQPEPGDTALTTPAHLARELRLGRGPGRGPPSWDGRRSPGGGLGRGR